jgi:hypothetical protein
MGVRFQTEPQERRMILFCVRMTDRENVATAGAGYHRVNLLYGAYHYRDNPDTLSQAF